MPLFKCASRLNRQTGGSAKFAPERCDQSTAAFEAVDRLRQSMFPRHSDAAAAASGSGGGDTDERLVTLDTVKLHGRINPQPNQRHKPRTKAIQSAPGQVEWCDERKGSPDQNARPLAAPLAAKGATSSRWFEN